MLQMSQSVQGAMMIPTLRTAAGKVQALGRALAPKLSGALRAGISARLLKSGAGYAQFVVALEPAVYYGRFQEYGLGTGASKPPSARTMRRRAAYANSMLIKRRVDIAKRSGLVTEAGALAGLGKKEARRQKLLARGGKLQGQRKPNMAAHPFLRPAVKFYRTSLRAWIIEQLWASIARFSAPDSRAA
jgi:hypothetical protein